MAEIARVARVSIRALQLAFLKYRGTTPMQFLQQQRLEMAHQLLSSPDARPSVGEVARMWLRSPRPVRRAILRALRGVSLGHPRAPALVPMPFT